MTFRSLALWLSGVLLPFAALAGDDLHDSVRKAAGEGADAQAEVAQMRRGGSATLDRLFALRDDAGTDAALRGMLDRVIDRVGGQRYCTASRLFWHTSWEEAQAAARQSGKPILSLRMLGLLTDELSCANSRFFRTTLYANREVSQYLRENFVLHWKSVRPVPKITIDFGDGRRMERTVTGNSIHYVLTPDGDIVDGLPGLYAPHEFLTKLKASRQITEWFLRNDETTKAAKASPTWREDVLNFYHTQCLARIESAWQADLNRIAKEEQEAQARAELARQVAAGAAPKNPPAAAAAEIALPKARMEIPILRNIVTRMERLERQTDEALWRKIAALHEVALDDASLALIRSQNPTATTNTATTNTATTSADTTSADTTVTATTAETKEQPLLRMLANLRSSIAIDTVRNEYVLHRRIHEWLGNGFESRNVERFNERVYGELFLTPQSDPWLGLIAPDTYSALKNDGLVGR